MALSLFVCLIAAPEGVSAFQNAHPDIPIITAALDRQLETKTAIFDLASVTRVTGFIIQLRLFQPACWFSAEMMKRGTIQITYPNYLAQNYKAEVYPG